MDKSQRFRRVWCVGSSALSEDGTHRRPLPLMPACVALDIQAPTNEITEQVSEAKRKKVTHAREARSAQRRILNELGCTDSDLLKINQLEVSVTFSNLFIHSSTGLAPLTSGKTCGPQPISSSPS